MIKTFTGKNSFALQASLRALIHEFQSEVGEFGVERFDASETDVDTLLQAVQSLPFLAPKKLVVITNIQSNTAFMDRLEDVVNRTPEQVEVLLVEPTLDKRKSGYALLRKLTKLQEFTEPKAQDLPRWLVEQAKNHSAEISLADATYLVERVGLNQQLLASEIEKLCLYSSKISRINIDLLTDQTLQSTIFTLLDAAFAGNSEKALQLYREQRAARIEPQYIVAMLTWQLQTLALAVHAEPPVEQSLIAVGVSPFTARKAAALAKNMTKKQLRIIISDLAELDRLIKTNVNPDAGIEFFLTQLRA